MENLKQYAIYTLINLLLVGVVVLLLRRPEPSAMEIVTPPPTPTPSPLRVYVSGAVLHPDVYSLPPGSILKDALMAAGGPSPEADLDSINLAMPLRDGMHVFVPRKGEATPAAAPVAPSPSSPSLININTASQAELESLPGIGPTLARRIIEFRETHGPFKSIEDLKKVPGIGEAIFSRIKDLITVQ
ncbi:MAG: helix-hairpin-helix domain-containing protein [Anaerolineae bacterium]|nr:helix-hairpin-helix domain-containing protein [Anaerolineae bacterium]MDW8101326.1 helix-hairpin-helix domain-containing protein [Anaerolineae bacterium]